MRVTMAFAFERMMKVDTVRFCRPLLLCCGEIMSRMLADYRRGGREEPIAPRILKSCRRGNLHAERAPIDVKPPGHRG